MVRTSKLVIILAAFGLFSAACSKDDNTPARLSNLGESCQSSGECAGSYVCRTGVCSVSTVGIAANTKVCELQQCTTTSDCCAQPPAICATYATACDGGLTAECTYAQQPPCVCDPNVACTAGQCVTTTTCTADMDCTTYGLTHCSPGGKCVACLTKSDCAVTTDVCVDNACVASCETKADCQAFYDCDTANKNCVFKGCTEDRECIVSLDNPQGFCNQTTHTCSAKCVNDVSCFNTQTPTLVSGSTIDYTYQLCVSGNCQNAGCDTDDECKALLSNRIQTAKVNYPHATAQCVAGK